MISSKYGTIDILASLPVPTLPVYNTKDGSHISPLVVYIVDHLLLASQYSCNNSETERDNGD
jgi:hypothetical protein